MIEVDQMNAQIIRVAKQKYELQLQLEAWQVRGWLTILNAYVVIIAIISNTLERHGIHDRKTVAQSCT